MEKNYNSSKAKITSSAYNIKKREEYWRKYWQKNKVYKFKEKSDKPVFSVDTPPPYVSASHLHAGHIMSYAQAEFVVRFKRMTGYNVFYPMGFDDNGLPTERFVEKKYKIDKSKITRKEFIKLCLKETKIGAENYKKLWNLLGISVDWSQTYSTINKHSQKVSQKSFIDLYKKGLIYRDEKPIMWCTTCQTAVSQADLEDQEKETNLVFIKVKTELGDELTFATTRPELLYSCVGISVYPSDKRYKKYIGKKIIMPLSGTEIEITTDKIVDPDFGTGIVYFCSSGDRQFLDWEKNHPIKNKIYLLNINGKMNKLAGPYQGLTILEARKKIIKDLEKISALDKAEKLVHTVNIHERCGTDIEYVNSKQWFVKLLENKDDFIKRGNELAWFPEFMRHRYMDWVNGLKWDWCISRQRYYGVPIPVYYDKNGRVVLAKKSELPIDPSETPKKELTPETDVMDTWMTSSMTPEIIGLFPKTLRPQAFEIIRTWLFYTIAKAHYHHNKLPFQQVMISGHGLAEDGKKLSKRLGNYKNPKDIIEKYGADALRYWATGARLGQNMRYSEKEVQKGKRTVIKIWNASRFVLMNLGDGFKMYKRFKPQKSADKEFYKNLQETIQQAYDYFEKYEYFKARNVIDKFFWNEFCSKYLELSKKRQDSDNKNCLYFALINILKLYAPILPFITEEIWHKLGYKNSIHLSQWPDVKNLWTKK